MFFDREVEINSQLTAAPPHSRMRFEREGNLDVALPDV